MQRSDSDFYRKMLTEANTHTAAIVENFQRLLSPEDVALILIAAGCRILESTGRENVVTVLLGFAAKYDDAATGEPETSG